MHKYIYISRTIIVARRREGEKFLLKEKGEWRTIVVDRAKK